MITLEKLIFTKELIISVSIEKSIVLEERYRFYPEYTKKFLGFIKCRQKNYMRDMIYSQESRKYENIEPGQSIRLPNSVFYCGVKDGIIGEDMYSDGSYKVYRLPYIIENDRGLKRRVIVQPEWRDFLMTNYRVIMEWVHDEKIKYLEKRKIEESAS